MHKRFDTSRLQLIWVAAGCLWAPGWAMAACTSASPVITISSLDRAGEIGDVITKIKDADPNYRSSLQLHVTPVDAALQSVEIVVNNNLETKLLISGAQELRPDGNGTVNLDIPYWIGENAPAKHVPLRRGQNTVTISATDAAGNCKQLNDLVARARVPGTFAVIIGINEYPEAAAKLEYARDDATAVAKHLLKYGNNIQPQNIYLLRDGTWPDDEDGVDKVMRQPATWASINEAIAQVTRKVDSNGTIIFYFSGHGFTLDDPSLLNHYYLLANDSTTTQPYRMLAVNEIVGRMGAAPADQKVIILDSCFSSEVFAGYRNRPQNLAGWPRALGPRANNAGLADLVRDKAYVMASSNSDQFSYELKTIGHGVFTFYLLQSAEDPANLAADVTISDAFKFARAAVQARLTKDLPGALQMPDHWEFRNVDIMPWRLRTRP